MTPALRSLVGGLGLCLGLAGYALLAARLAAAAGGWPIWAQTLLYLALGLLWLAPARALLRWIAQDDEEKTR